MASVGLLFGLADAFFTPASGSILRSLVDGIDLPRANALVGVSEQAASLIGPVLGGGLLAATSSSVASYTSARCTPVRRLSGTSRAGAAVENVNAATWHSVHAA